MLRRTGTGIEVSVLDEDSLQMIGFYNFNGISVPFLCYLLTRCRVTGRIAIFRILTIILL